MSAAARPLTLVPVDTLRFVALQGVMAKNMGKRLCDCPHGVPGNARAAADNVKAAVWRWAFKGAPTTAGQGSGSRRSTASAVAFAGRAASIGGETVSREKDPRGLPWTKVQLQVLRACAGVYTAGEIGAMVGRSDAAVRVRLCRLRKEEGIADSAPASTARSAGVTGRAHA